MKKVKIKVLKGGGLRRPDEEGNGGENALGMITGMPGLINYPCKGNPIKRETPLLIPMTPTHYSRVGKLLREGDQGKQLRKRLLPRGSASRSGRRNRGTRSGEGRGWINGGRGLDPCHHFMSAWLR